MKLTKDEILERLENYQSLIQDAIDYAEYIDDGKIVDLDNDDDDDLINVDAEIIDLINY